MPTSFDPQTIWMVAILLVAYGAFKYVIPRLVAGVPFFEPQAVQQRIAAGEDVVILDVRTTGEFSGGKGHVPGAVNLPLNEISSRLQAHSEEWEALKDLPIFVMCQTANRSPTAARMLKKRGFSNISVIKGGMSAWKRAGLPVEGA